MNANSALVTVFGPYAFPMALTLIIVICLTVGLGAWTALRLWDTPITMIPNPHQRALAIVGLTVVAPLIFLFPFLVAILAPGLVEPVLVGILILGLLAGVADWFMRRRAR